MNPKEIFSSFNDLNVLVIGDVMIDRYLTGKVGRISPEAPVPIVNLKASEDRLGGAANVALNIKAMGATPFLCSLIGKDENAATFLNLLPEQSIKTEGIIQSSERVTTVKTRVIAANQHLLRVDREDDHDLSKSEREQLFSTIHKILNQQEIHVILLQDYNKGVLSCEVIRFVLSEAIRREIPTVVDPKFNNFFEYQKATLFKPNLKEVTEAVPFQLNSNPDQLLKASEYLRSKLKNKYTMITLSDKGIFIDDGALNSIVPTQPRSIADVCGAGDTVISIAALCLAMSLKPEDMAILANLAGGQVCEQVGVVPVNKSQLLNEYQQLLKHSET